MRETGMGTEGGMGSEKRVLFYVVRRDFPDGWHVSRDMEEVRE